MSVWRHEDSFQVGAMYGVVSLGLILGAYTFNGPLFAGSLGAALALGLILILGFNRIRKWFGKSEIKVVNESG